MKLCRNANIPNKCVFEYKVDVAPTTATCSDYISMIMENYSLDEDSVPIAPEFKNKGISLSSKQKQSVQLYVATGAKQPMCNYTL